MASHCESFRVNPLINPVTGQSIEFGELAYEQLRVMCGDPYSTLSSSPNPREQRILEWLHSSSYEAGIPSPTHLTQTCTLINTKKIDKYIFTYNPQPMLDRLKYEMGFTEEQLDIFDPVPRQNCCNVISIALYLRLQYRSDLVQIRNKYLFSIARTIQDVKVNLPDWIVRLYLDTSVYDLFNDAYLEALIESRFETKIDFPKVVEEVRSYIQFILDAPNVEVYSYICPDTPENIARIRSYRFLPLSDPEVNMCAVRDADGVVTNLDCHNLKVFTEEIPGKLFYLPMVIPAYHVYKLYGTTRINYSSYMTHESYSLWLKMYKRAFLSDFYKANVTLYDLLAGTFACKLKIKRSLYLQKSEEVNRNIQYYIDVIIEEKVRQIQSMDPESFPRNYTQEDQIQEVRSDSGPLKSGYDEILLMCIYQNFTTRRYGDDISVYDAYVNQLFYADNVPLIDLKSNLQIRKTFADHGIRLDPRRLRIQRTCFDHRKLPLQTRGTMDEIGPLFDNGHEAYFIDSLLQHNSSKEIFNVVFSGIKYSGYGSETMSFPCYLSTYLNVPYNPIFNPCYDMELM